MEVINEQPGFWEAPEVCKHCLSLKGVHSWRKGTRTNTRVPDLGKVTGLPGSASGRSAVEQRQQHRACSWVTCRPTVLPGHGVL